MQVVLQQCRSSTPKQMMTFHVSFSFTMHLRLPRVKSLPSFHEIRSWNMQNRSISEKYRSHLRQTILYIPSSGILQKFKQHRRGESNRAIPMLLSQSWITAWIHRIRIFRRIYGTIKAKRDLMQMDMTNERTELMMTVTVTLTIGRDGILPARHKARHRITILPAYRTVRRTAFT